MSYNEELQSNNAYLQEILRSVNELPDEVTDAVRYSVQSLDDVQKEQARQNIGALASAELPTAIDTALAQAKASGEFDGKDGKDGSNVTVKSVSESTADGGSNVVTFSDGKTLTVKNGKTGAAGKDGKDGKTPENGVDYNTPAEQEAIVQQVIAALGTPVFGTVDADKNIILTGNLADGTYTIKYEDAEGNLTEIGTIEVGEKMPDSGSIEITWADGVKLDKNTGAEGSGDGYAASQHIELVDGYAYTVDQHAAPGGHIYGGINIFYYDANGNGLGYELLWDADAAKHTKTLTPLANAATFRLRLYYGSGFDSRCYSVTFEKTA